MKFSTYFLGCRVNQAEIEFFENKLINLGLEISKDGQADIIIFNTCSVTHKAEKESYRLIKKIFSLNPNSKLFITGCIVPLNKNLIQQVKQKFLNDELKEKENNIFIIPSTQKEKIIQIIQDNLLTDNNYQGIQQKNQLKFKYYIKIQDGCNHFCSFCIIPFTRGRSRSKPPNQVIEEIKQITENLKNNPNHFAEITLTGICLGEYGLDINTTLAKLIKSITSFIPDNCRIRLSSMDIITLDQELIEQLATNPKLCKFLHLSLQSGSNKILKLMKRNYTSEQYLYMINELYKNIPDIGITTDIIVGFPSETEEDFNQTLEVVKQAQFHRIHIFPFSFRPYTYAYQKMQNLKIDHLTIKEREKILTNLSLQQSKNFINQRIGKYYHVLIEENGYGYTDNFIRVKTNLQGIAYRKIKITGIQEEKGNFAVASTEL